MLIWDLEILEGLGLPPKSANIILFNVKQYLPVLWIASNPKAYRDGYLPTEAPFAKIDMAEDFSLCDVFSIVLDADSSDSHMRCFVMWLGPHRANPGSVCSSNWKFSRNTA